MHSLTLLSCYLLCKWLSGLARVHFVSQINRYHRISQTAHPLCTLTYIRHGGWSRSVSLMREPCSEISDGPSAAEPKSPQNNARNHRYSVILYWSTHVGMFEGHFVYLGEISEQRSLIKETDRDQPPWRIYVSVHKGCAVCGLRSQSERAKMDTHLVWYIGLTPLVSN